VELFTENTVQSIRLPKNSNFVNYSVLKEFYSPSPFRSFSIKYVSEGDELYSVNGNNYRIKDKEFLFANSHSEGFVEVDSKKPVTGICIDIAPDILSEVLAYHLTPSAPISDLGLDTFFNSKDFLENKYHASQTRTGKFLLEIENDLKEQPRSGVLFNKDFYFKLSEYIIADHVPLIKQLQQVKAVKTETRKELLRRAMRAKSFIDSYFLQEIPIDVIAKDVALSEYHFIRLFKTIYNLSPHQYIIQKRLAFARERILKDDISLSTIALMAGFSDVHSFSKSFKKQYGFSPSKLTQHFFK
jgi:AraC family transcriptional regulator